jgi:hypothetical protein
MLSKTTAATSFRLKAEATPRLLTADMLSRF